MEHTSLCDLVSCLEYGTNMHISIVFLDNFGNFKTSLPKEMVIHSKPFCDFMKATPEGFNKCFKCRNLALKKAINTKKAFGDLCFNGIYEYLYPVIEKDDVIAVIFIGNILLGASNHYSNDINKFINTFEKGFNEKIIINFCHIIENHIKLLISEYSNIKQKFNPLISNIINYIEESLYCDFSVGQIAGIFNYNEKYIGKLFKKHTGQTLKEYLNGKRLKKAKELLKSTTISVIEISSKIGFNNVTYFNRLFKKHFNMSPTEYRKK